MAWLSGVGSGKWKREDSLHTGQFTFFKKKYSLCTGDYFSNAKKGYQRSTALLLLSSLPQFKEMSHVPTHLFEEKYCLLVQEVWVISLSIFPFNERGQPLHCSIYSYHTLLVAFGFLAKHQCILSVIKTCRASEIPLIWEGEHGPSTH